MFTIVKVHQMKRLAAKYNRVKNEAVRLMKSGDLHNYIMKLAEVEKIRSMYMATIKA